MEPSFAMLPRDRTDRLGRPREVDLREVVNGFVYQCSGCQGTMLPHDLLPKSTVYDYFSQWRDDGTCRSDRRAATASCVAAGREATPSAACIDSQSVKTTSRREDRGYDGGKKIKGRKRHFAGRYPRFADPVLITAASLDDGAAAPPLLAQVSPQKFRGWRRSSGTASTTTKLAAWLKENRPIAIEVRCAPQGRKASLR